MANGKPAFRNVIGCQHNTGYWASDTLYVFEGLFKEKQADDVTVREHLSALINVDPEADKDTLYMTLLAIYVLAEVFADEEDQWILLVRKAKTFLKKAGIAKPEKLVKLFSLTFV